MNLFTHNYLTRGFWGDEAWTALISQLPLSEILRVTGEDFHPPFYYFIVHFWGNIFGFGEISIRLISIIFFLLTVVAAYFLARQFIKPKLYQLTFSFLVLTSPILFTYALEARSYALLAFLSITSALAFWRARTETGYLWRILYFLIGSISVYTHYYSWFILASHGLYLLLFERQYFLKLLPPAAGILLVQLPWLPILFAQVGEVNRSYWIAPINFRTHWEFFLRVAGGDYTTDFQHPASYFILFSVATYLFSQSKKYTQQSKFLLSWLLIPTLLPTIISIIFAPIFFYRYLIFSSIPLLIIFVLGISKLPKPAALSAAVFLAFFYLAITYQNFSRYPTSMREVVADVYQSKSPGDSPIYTVLPSFAETYYYASAKDDIKVLDEGIIQFSGKSLLDSFVRSGKVEIVTPPTEPYWFLQPGPKGSLIDPSQS